MIAALLLVAQGPWVAIPATQNVGDTVRLERELPVAVGAQARVPGLEMSHLVEPLGDPISQVAEGRLRVLYRVALFDVGRRAVPMPDVELVSPDGTVRIVFGDTAWVNVASVLPADKDSVSAAQASMGPLARPPTNPIPLIVLVGVGALGLSAWAVAHRRVSSQPRREWTLGEDAVPPVDRWAGAGELRAVAATVADRLRERIARLEPRAGRHLDTTACLHLLDDVRAEWPLRDLSALLSALERARFAPVVPGDTVVLIDEAERMLAVLGREIP